METELTSEQVEFTETIHSSGVALLALINDILDFSKIEAGRLELEMIDFDLESKIVDIIHLLDSKAETKGLELIVDYGSQCPKFVTGDPGRIRQIIINLVGNAIKFTAKGHVLLRVRSKEDKDGQTEFHFEVEDTGIGIALDQQKTLFDVFTQADSSTTREYGGSGLGLTISKRLVELMDGNIGVTSQPGHGTIFHFFLPLHLTQEPEPLHGAKLNGARILVVDDYATNRRVFKGQLQAFGIEVETAPSAHEALIRLRNAIQTGKPFDIVLTDQNMPTMDGLTLTRIIRSEFSEGSAAIVVVTSSGHRGNISAFQNVGAAGYLVKPVDRHTMYEFLTGVLGEKESPNPRFITRHVLSDTSQKPLQLMSKPFSGRILVAEDTVANQVVIRTLLKKLGVESVVVNDGDEAVDIYLKDQFDLIFMDLRMPNMDGFEATSTIRSHEKQTQTHTPIIALTADVTPQTKSETVNVGMDDCVTKPFQKKDIIDVLSKYLKSDGATMNPANRYCRFARIGSTSNGKRYRKRF